MGLDMTETVGDRRMYLSTTSMGTGYLAECLLSMELYRNTPDPSVLRPSIHECKRFIDDFISTLEKSDGAPFVMRKIAEYLNEQETKNSISYWKSIEDTIKRAEKGESIYDLEERIRTLRTVIDDFNKLRQIVTEKLYVGQRSPVEQL